MATSQRGTAYLSILFGVVAFIFIAKFLLAIWPAYWDDRVINNQIKESLLEAPFDSTPSSFRTQVSQGLERYNITDIQFADIAKISNENNGLKVIKQYEVRRHFFSSIDLVLTFEKSFDQRSVQSR